MANDTSLPPGTNEAPNPEAVMPRGSLLAGRRKWAILAVGLLLLATGYLAWQRRSTAPLVTGNTNSTQSTNSATRNNTSPTFQQVTVPVVADSDKDGLTDDREATLKTNPKLADTDGDELSDYDEVEVYKTKPLVQDTDGDGFSDGTEVRSGNNPNGPGKLVDLNKSISNINTQ